MPEKNMADKEDIAKADKLFESLDFDNMFKGPDFEEEVEFKKVEEDSLFSQSIPPLQPNPTNSPLDYVSVNQKIIEQTKQTNKPKKNKYASEQPKESSEEKNTITDKIPDEKSQPKENIPEEPTIQDKEHTVQLDIEESEPEPEVIMGYVMTDDNDEDFTTEPIVEENSTHIKESPSDEQPSPDNRQKLSEEDIEVIKPTNDEPVIKLEIIPTIMSFITILCLCIGILAFSKSKIPQTKPENNGTNKETTEATVINIEPIIQEEITTEATIEEITPVNNNETLIEDLIDESNNQESKRFQNLDELTTFINDNTWLAYKRLQEINNKQKLHPERDYSKKIGEYKKAVNELEKLLDANQQEYSNQDRESDYEMLMKNIQTVQSLINQL